MALAFTISKSLQGVRGSEGEGREVGEGESGDGESEREKGIPINIWQSAGKYIKD